MATKGRKPLAIPDRRSQRVMSRITQAEYLALELAVAQYNELQPHGSPTITTSKYVQICIQNNKRVMRNLINQRGDK
jgi:hypothetical protein